MDMANFVDFALYIRRRIKIFFSKLIETSFNSAVLAFYYKLKLQLLLFSLFFSREENLVFTWVSFEVWCWNIAALRYT
jgi:hypothetical protein